MNFWYKFFEYGRKTNNPIFCDLIEFIIKKVESRKTPMSIKILIFLLSTIPILGIIILLIIFGLKEAKEIPLVIVFFLVILYFLLLKGFIKKCRKKDNYKF